MDRIQPITKIDRARVLREAARAMNDWSARLQRIPDQAQSGLAHIYGAGPLSRSECKLFRKDIDVLMAKLAVIRADVCMCGRDGIHPHPAENGLGWATACDECRITSEDAAVFGMPGEGVAASQWEEWSAQFAKEVAQ